jgi:antitoxin FitA
LGVALPEALQCSYNACMPVAITVRDVPDEVRDELASRAALAGQSLQEYLRRSLIEQTSRPTVDQVIARSRARLRSSGNSFSVDSIVAHRDADRP